MPRYLPLALSLLSLTPVLALAQTVELARVGVEPDGSTWMTKLWLIGAREGISPGSVPAPSSVKTPRNRPPSAILAFLDTTGKPLAVTARLPGGTPTVTDNLRVALPQYADQEIVLTGATNTSAPTTFRIQAHVPPGYLIFALFQCRDKMGIPSQCITDPLPATPIGPAEMLGVAFDTEPGGDMALIFSAAAGADLPVTVEAYDIGAVHPFATGKLTVPSQGTFMARMVREAFVESPAFASHLSAVGASFHGILRLTAARLFSMVPLKIDTSADGGLVQSVAYLHGPQAAYRTPMRPPHR